MNWRDFNRWDALLLGGIASVAAGVAAIIKWWRFVSR